MSDESRDDAQQTPEPTSEVPSEATRPRPQPRPADAEPVDEPAAPGPVSAASRARRIGGRPVIPTASSADADKKQPTPSSAGVGRHLAAPAATPAKPAKAPKAPKEPKAPKAAKEPKADKAAKEPKAPKARNETDGSATTWIPAGVLGVAALVLIVLIAIASHGVYWAKTGVSASSRNTNQQTALAAAKTCVATINTYDYRDIQTAETAALACTTGKFTSDLKTVYEKTLKVEAPPAKATQTAQVNQAGIRDVASNGDQVDVLIFGQLTLTNATTAASSPQYDPFGAVVTMNKVGSKWLVSKVAADVGGTVGS